ncbi:hypothetical protein SUDANB105_08013 [Streptomyces sp. enrichment culture]
MRAGRVPGAGARRPRPGGWVAAGRGRGEVSGERGRVRLEERVSRAPPPRGPRGGPVPGVARGWGLAGADRLGWAGAGRGVGAATVRAVTVPQGRRVGALGVPAAWRDGRAGGAAGKGGAGRLLLVPGGAGHAVHESAGPSSGRLKSSPGRARGGRGACTRRGAGGGPAPGAARSGRAARPDRVRAAAARARRCRARRTRGAGSVRGAAAERRIRHGAASGTTPGGRGGWRWVCGRPHVRTGPACGCRTGPECGCGGQRRLLARVPARPTRVVGSGTVEKP